jgi:hypothetical protein
MAASPNPYACSFVIPQQSSSSCYKKVTKQTHSLDFHLSAIRPPVKNVGSERHSSRICKPLKQAADPDNAEAASSVEDAALGQKRKVGGSGSSCCVTCKVVESDSGSEKGSDHNDPASNNGIEDSSDEEDQARTMPSMTV